MLNIFCLNDDFVNLQPIKIKVKQRLVLVEIPFGHIENQSLYRSAFGDYDALVLETADVEDWTDKVAFFKGSFDRLKAKFDEIENKINTQSNKGSFLSSLLNIKSKIPEHKGLGDYANLLGKIEIHALDLTAYVQKNRQRNTDIKQALLLELEEILKNNDQEEAFEQIKDIKIRWIKTGSPNLDVKESVETAFKSGLDGFFERRNAFSEDKRMLVEARVTDYKDVIAGIQSFIDQKNFGKSFDQVKALQVRWKEIGSIPDSEYKQLNSQYWKTTKAYFEEQKKFRSDERKNQKKSSKQSLATKTDVLTRFKTLVENGFHATNTDFETIRKEWKESGHLSKKDNAAIHDEFLSLSRAFQERQFILELTKRKNKGFTSKDGKEQLKDLTKVIRTLLHRDESELNSFTENMDKMHINKGSFVDMLETKLSNQRDKVTLKKSLLKECQEKLKQL